MRQFLVLSVILTVGCLVWAQQSPPANGIGLGNLHLSGNSTDSNVPSMSADQNQQMTDSNGSTSGAKGIPAFAGSPSYDTATEVNSQGTFGATNWTNATWSTRVGYGLNQAAGKGNEPGKVGLAKPNATSPLWSVPAGFLMEWPGSESGSDPQQELSQNQGKQANNQNQKEKKGKAETGKKSESSKAQKGEKSNGISKNAEPAHTGELLGNNMGVTTTSTPGPSTAISGHPEKKKAVQKKKDQQPPK